MSEITHTDPGPEAAVCGCPCHYERGTYDEHVTCDGIISCRPHESPDND